MNINTTTLLNLLTPKMNSQIQSKIEGLSKDGKVEIASLLKDKSLQTILNGLFKDILAGLKTKGQVSQLLQNSKPMFDFKSLSTDIKNVLEQIKDNPKLVKQTAVLKQFLTDIKNIDEKVLKSNLNNSGVFLESKLLKQSPNITTDIKAIILQLQDSVDSKLSEKIMSQIEYYQLLSYTTASNHSYLPFDWQDIEDGDIKFNSNDKDTFSCHISLKLKHKGDINVKLLLDKKNNLNINMSIEKSDFKLQIQDNLQKLRQGINNIGLSLQSLNIFDIQKEEDKSYEQKAYNSNENINIGVDIKV